MLWKLTQRTFNGGQLDRRLMGRTDLAKYYQGASVLKNFIVKRQGCIVKRRGTVQIADVSAILNDRTITDYRLLPFTYENEYGYILLFTASSLGNKCHVFNKDGEKKATINVPYAGTDLDQISTEQSGDTLFLAHQSYPFAKITRYDETDWRYEVVNFENCGHASLPAAPTIASVDKLPAGSWTGDGPEKSVFFYATAVKDGIESRPSNPFKVTYATPWPEGCMMRITIAEQNPAPDYYNVYKKQDSYTGLIGTTSDGMSKTGEAVLTTLPSSTGANKRYENPNSPTNSSNQGQHSRAVNDANSAGWVVSNGIYTVTYSQAQEIDAVSLALGYVWYAIPQDIYTFQTDPQYDCWYYIECLPCKCSKIKATVTFDDDSTWVSTLDVPSSVKTLTVDKSVRGDPYSSAVGSAISTRRQQLARNATLTWTIDRDDGQGGKKKIKSVVFTAYADSECTTVATGAIGAMSVPNVNWQRTSYKGRDAYYNQNEGQYTASTITGNPFTISGYWATRFTMTAINNIVDEYITPDASLTPPVYKPHFSDTGEYPGCVAMYQQRLALARTANQPFTFWLSCIGDLYNFNTHDSIREDDAMEVTLPATKYPDINHMILNRDLIMFCDSGEWIVAPVTGNTLTYKTISTKIQSQLGSSKHIKPIVIGNDVIFANMTNETLIATKYSYATDGYESTDLSVLSQDIFRGNTITSLAYKQHPDSIIVATLADGTFATLEYMKEHEVVAWSHHELGGGLKARYCCADGSVTDGTTDVYIIAEDTSDQATQRFYLLRAKEDAPLNTVRQCVAMDQMYEAEGAGTIPENFVAVNVRTGEAETTRRAGHTYMLGRPFSAELVTVKPEPNANETVRFEVKNPTEVEICVNEGSSFKVGQLSMDASKDKTVSLDPTVTPYEGGYHEGHVALGTKDVKTLLAGTNNRDGRIRLTSDGYWPLTVLSLSVTYQIELANQEPKDARGERE